MSSNDGAWRVFQRLIDDAPAIALVETSWIEGGPDRIKPWTIVVRIRAKQPNEQGMPHGQELAALQELDEKIAEGLAASHRATFLASLTSAGVRSLYFAAPKADNVTARVGEVLEPEGYEPLVEAARDPAWERIGEAWPSPQELRWNNDVMVLQQLEESGDDARIARPIEHLAYLPSASARDDFVAWARGEGFEVGDAHAGPDAGPDEDGRWRVVFVKESPAEIEEIFEQSSSAEDAAEELGGEYDGWECRVCTGD
jgi:hypothetical protein